MDPRPSIDAVLQDAGWLRALALQLVGPVAADDLVQEAYVATLASAEPPRDRRAWLATVLRRKASNARRASRNRADAEAECAAQAAGRDTDPHESASPQPADRMERLELQRALLAAVAELPPDRRSVLLGRYLEDRTPAELATELGVPAGTVRSRLARGLAELRTKLDARYGRDTWLAALGPWAVRLAPAAEVPLGVHAASNGSVGTPSGSGPMFQTLGAPPSVAGSSARLASWLGGVMMWKQLVAAMAVVLALGWWVAGSRERAAPEPERATVVSNAPFAATGGAAPTRSAERLQRELVEVASPPALAPGVVAGSPAVRELVVVDAETGLGLGEVEVRLLNRAWVEAARGVLDSLPGEVVARSGSDGTVRIEVSEGVPTEVLLHKAGYAERVVPVAPPIESASGQAAAHVELPRLRRIAVRVVDSHGAPMPGVTVRSTAGDDRVEVDIGDTRWISIGSGPWDGRWRRSSAEPTNADGVTRLDAFHSVEFEVWRGTALLSSSSRPEVQELDGEHWVTLRVGAALRLAGTLHDAHGQPVAGQRLELAWGGRALRPSARLVTRTQEDGAWAFDPVPTDVSGDAMDTLRLFGGRGQDRPLPEDQRVVVPEIDWAVARDGALFIELRAVATGSIAGRVVDGAGGPVAADRRFSIEARTLEGEFAGSGWAVAGRFEVRGLVPGDYALRLRQPGAEDWDEVVASVGQDDVELVAVAAQRLPLELLRADTLDTETLVGNSRDIRCYTADGEVASIEMTMGASRAFAETVEAVTGELVAGDYRVVVRTPEGLVGYVDARVPWERSGEVDGRGRLPVSMELGGRLSVEVAFARGANRAANVHLEWGGGVSVGTTHSRPRSSSPQGR